MKHSLEQLRCANALVHSNKIGRGKEGGDRVKSFASMVQINGLLASLAYAGKDEAANAEKDICNAIIHHLRRVKEEGYAFFSMEITKPEDFADYLKRCSVTEFRQINVEVIAFLNYLRRFAS
ncbi:MAG: hypothetical protein D6820_14915 [Lentisphaerae bacterium]|nr:MAG: hypothetical protein D6820_14915 [Lentisphaerota bacterium]